jgi:hypothetical protein
MGLSAYFISALKNPVMAVMSLFSLAVVLASASAADRPRN